MSDVNSFLNVKIDLIMKNSIVPVEQWPRYKVVFRPAPVFQYYLQTNRLFI